MYLVKLFNITLAIFFCVKVLDAVQFLHHRGIIHLNIQPDNVVMHSRRRFDIKLIDFGLAHKITTVDGSIIDRIGPAEFMGNERYTFVTSLFMLFHNRSIKAEANMQYNQQFTFNM
jgi:serine/threonine protein kinase